MPPCARCRSRTARVSRSVVSSSPCAWAVARGAARAFHLGSFPGSIPRAPSMPLD
jgi:hypothetical protein